MTLQRLLPTPRIYPDLTEDAQSWEIAKWFGICNGWRVNFVVNQALEKSGKDGSSHDISSQLDRLLLAKLRAQADLIVTSGETARVERYKSSKQAPLAIITRTGDLDVVPAVQGIQYFTPFVITDEDHLITVQNSLSDVDVKILSYNPIVGDKWPSSIATLITRAGFQSPILESGALTVRNFIAADVIDEVCLTITKHSSEKFSARNLKPQALSNLFSLPHPFALQDLFVTENALFTRWVRFGVAATNHPPQHLAL